MSNTSFSNHSVTHMLELLDKILDEINLSMPRCRSSGNSGKIFRRLLAKLPALKITF